MSSAPAADVPLLEVSDLVVRYPVGRGLRTRNWVQAVSGVSLSVRAGELVALVGESGCGKTTTAQAVMRMIEPEQGRIAFRGEDIAALSQRRMRPLRRRMQIVFQDPYESLDPRCTVRDAVTEPLAIHREPRADRERRVEQALARAGLTPPARFLDRYPHELSGGQRQRVAIAAALVLEPQLLVADEPVSMLDISVRAGVLNLLAELKSNGLGILMITHDLSTAARYADRLCVMYLGRIVEEGATRDVVSAPQHPYTQALVAAVPRTDPASRPRGATLGGEAPDPAAVPSGCRFHPRCPIAVPDCSQTDPRLAPVGGGRHRAACLLAPTSTPSTEGNAR
jgi:oligopeptide/dipeptide ABC transporter ATP-binding protein